MGPFRSRRGVTLVEILVVAAVIVVLISIALPAMLQTSITSRHTRDATKVRAIHQALFSWSNGGRDQYPLPSELDVGNTTLGPTAFKDATRDIISILVFNGMLSLEDCISVDEPSSQIKAYKRYEFREPAAAAAENKALALWDPAFRALPADTSRGPVNRTGAPGGFSFAMMPPIGTRAQAWRKTMSSTEVIVGNRGGLYQYEGTPPFGGWVLQTSPGIPLGTRSMATRFYYRGDATSKTRGNVCFNDGHVVFEEHLSADSRVRFSFTGLPNGGAQLPDSQYVNENDGTRAAMQETCSLVNGATDGLQRNAYLRSYTRGTMDSRGRMTSITPWFD